jgi:putative membrane protein
VMVSRQAGAYRSLVLLAALVGALILPWPLIVLTGWSAAAILLAQAALAATILAAGQSRRLRLALVPRRLRGARAREAAQRAFWSRGLSLTRGRTGILLYLSLAERHAEIVADLGVLRHIAPAAWDEILADLVRTLGRGETEAGLTAAVERVGRCLAEHLPAGAGDPDELPNRVIVVD